MKNNYTYAKTGSDDASLSKYFSLLKTVYPNKKSLTLNYLKWLYTENPVGKVIGFDAFENNCLVAHYVTIPVNYYFNKREYRGLLSLNTVTHPDHRGKGLFPALANKTIEHATQIGYDFIIGVANANSAPVFLNKLNFKILGPLMVKIGIGNIFYTAENENSFRGYRNHEFIQWRISNPGAYYFQTNNFLFSPSGKPGISVILGKLNDDRIVNIPEKKALISVWIGLAKYKVKKGIMLKLPGFLKPSPLLLIFKKLNFDMPDIATDDVFFEAIDFDAY